MYGMLRNQRSVKKASKGKGIGGKPYKEKQRKRKHPKATSYTSALKNTWPKRCWYSTSGIKTNELCWFRGSSIHTKDKSWKRTAKNVKLPMSTHSNADNKESEPTSSWYFPSGIMTNELCWFRDSFTQSIEKSKKKTGGNVNQPKLIPNNLNSKEVKQANSFYTTSGIKTNELCWFRDSFTHSKHKPPNHNIHAKIMCSNEQSEDLSYCNSGIKTRDLCWFRDGPHDQWIQSKLTSKTIASKYNAEVFSASKFDSVGGKTRSRVSLKIALESTREISSSSAPDFDDATGFSPPELTRSRTGSRIIRAD